MRSTKLYDNKSKKTEFQTLRSMFAKLDNQLAEREVKRKKAKENKLK